MTTQTQEPDISEDTPQPRAKPRKKRTVKIGRWILQKAKPEADVLDQWSDFASSTGVKNEKPGDLFTDKDQVRKFVQDNKLVGKFRTIQVKDEFDAVSEQVTQFKLK